MQLPPKLPRLLPVRPDSPLSRLLHFERQELVVSKLSHQLEVPALLYLLRPLRMHPKKG